MNGRYLINKLARAFLTIVAIMLINFLLFRAMPGSAVRLTHSPYQTQEQIDQQMHKLGLDQPLIPNQLVTYVQQTLTGNLGESFKYKGQPVTQVIADRLGPTLILIGLGEVIAIILGLLLGAYSGWRRGSAVDRIGGGIGLILYSMPYFVIGMPLIVIFAAGLGWFPTSGMLDVGATYDLPDCPAARPCAAPRAPLATVSRWASWRGTPSSARGDRGDPRRGLRDHGPCEGLTDGRILRTHAFPNAMLPMVTIIAINLGYVVGGAITAEIVFNWPGIGTLTVDALSARDYPVLQGIFLMLAVTVVPQTCGRLYGLLDPRCARERRHGHRPRLSRTRGLREFLTKFSTVGRTASWASPSSWSSPSSPLPRPSSSGRSRASSARPACRSTRRPHRTSGHRRAGPRHAQPDCPRRSISMVIGLLATIITVVVGVGLGIISGFAGRLATDPHVADRRVPGPAEPGARHRARADPARHRRRRGGDPRHQGQAHRHRHRHRPDQLAATTARVIRSQVLSLKERAFVDRARVIGTGSGRIMRRHILPNIINLIVAQAVLTFAYAVFTETSPAVHRPRRPVQPVVGPDPQRRPGGRPRPARVVVHRPARRLRGHGGRRVHARGQRARRRAEPQVRSPPMTAPQDRPGGAARMPPPPSAGDASGRCRSRPSQARRCSRSNTSRSASR
ncbi:MAG: ABC transporter permease subunit [Chloroflexota bacterium]